MFFDRRTLLFSFALMSVAATTLAQTAPKGEIRIRAKDATGHAVKAHGTLSGPTGGRSRVVEMAPDGSLM